MVTKKFSSFVHHSIMFMALPLGFVSYLMCVYLMRVWLNACVYEHAGVHIYLCMHVHEGVYRNITLKNKCGKILQLLRYLHVKVVR